MPTKVRQSVQNYNIARIKTRPFDVHPPFDVRLISDRPKWLHQINCTIFFPENQYRRSVCHFMDIIFMCAGMLPSTEINWLASADLRTGEAIQLYTTGVDYIYIYIPGIDITRNENIRP